MNIKILTAPLPHFQYNSENTERDNTTSASRQGRPSPRGEYFSKDGRQAFGRTSESNQEHGEAVQN